MIYIQHGPSWKPKMDLLLKENLADGIIWDPREEKIDRINQSKNDNSDYTKVFNMVDLKWYYSQFFNPTLKELKNINYMPNCTIDRNYLRDTEKLNKNFNDMIEFQKNLNTNCVVTPSLYISSFNERYIDKLFDIWDAFKLLGEKMPKFISLMIHESAFDNDSYMRDFINDISNYSDFFKGVYIVIDRDNTSLLRNGFSSNRLALLMQFIYDLKRIGFEVIIGYCGLESINYMAVGADSIGTGWFYSLRRFNKLEKGLEPHKRGGHAKKRYTSINYLNEISIEDHIFVLPDEQKEKLIPKILNINSKYDSYIKQGNYAAIPTNQMFCQYFEAMNDLFKNFNVLETIEDRLNLLESIINNAISNISEYNQLKQRDIIMNLMQKEHLEDYKKAIQIFKNQNFI